MSPYLFILCAEILACKLRENQRIKGIKISDVDLKISQFADDTTIFLEGDKDSYEILFEDLRKYENMSGLKLNDDKTCNFWLGSKKNCTVQYLEGPKNDLEPA